MTWAWASPACSTSSPRRNVSRLCWVIMYVIRTNLYLPYCSHGQLSSHHWRGVRHTHHWGGRQKDQATDLGHGGSGAIQGSDTLLLPWSSWCADGLRYYQAVSEASYYLRNCFTTWPFQLHLQSPEQLAYRHSQSHQSQHCDLSHWQQIGSGEHSGGYLRGGQGVCRRERPNVSRSERYDVSYNWKHSVWAYTDYLFPPKQWPECGGGFSGDRTQDLPEHPGGSARSERLRIRSSAQAIAAVANFAE